MLELQQANVSYVKHSEIHLYLEEDVETQITNPLQYWKVHEHRFPALAQMARDFLAIPASSVPSEAAFSQAGRVLDDYRSSLDPATVSALMLTKSWMEACDNFNWKRPIIHINMQQKEVEDPLDVDVDRH